MCDPVDGTTNFVHSFPFVCVCIGLAIDKEVWEIPWTDTDAIFCCFWGASLPVWLSVGSVGVTGSRIRYEGLSEVPWSALHCHQWTETRCWLS